MPCYDGQWDGPMSRSCGSEIRTAKKRWRHNSPVAEMLCDVIKKVDALPYPTRSSLRLTDLPADAQEWWKEHQRRDARKAAADKKALKEAEQKTKDRLEREALLKKLSPRERKLLGHK